MVVNCWVPGPTWPGSVPHHQYVAKVGWPRVPAFVGAAGVNPNLSRRIPFGGHPLELELAWPMRMDDTHKSGSVLNFTHSHLSRNLLRCSLDLRFRVVLGRKTDLPLGRNGAPGREAGLNLIWRASALGRRCSRSTSTDLWRVSCGFRVRVFVSARSL